MSKERLVPFTVDAHLLEELGTRLILGNVSMG